MSVVLALAMASASALSASSTTVDTPDEPSVIEQTEVATTDEVGLSSTVATVDVPEETEVKPSLFGAALSRIIKPSGAAGEEDASGTVGHVDWTFTAKTKTLTISGEGTMSSYYYTSDVPWYSFRSSIEKVVIEKGVTSIGDKVFYYLNNMTDLTIADSVLSIGNSSFRYCSKLQKITIPNSVKSIGESAFQNCTALTEIEIPNSVTTISSSAFASCEALESVTVPGSVNTLGSSAFSGCKNLKSVSLPDSIIRISASAFSGCTSLKSITIPTTVSSIDEYAFSDCTGLTSVNIPSSVTSMGTGVFNGCTGMVSVKLPENIPVLSAGLFNNCKSLTKIEFPSSVKSIGDSAFEGCTVLGEVSFPDNIVSVGNSAFRSCTSLTKITFTDKITSIGESAFASCTNLPSVSIPSGISALSDSMFSGCSRLTKIEIPDNITKIGNHAFRNCTGAVSLSISDKVTQIGDCAFQGCTGLTSINIPTSVKKLGSSAFADCTGIKEINIPNSVTSVGSSVFSGCTNLIKAVIPDSLTKVGDGMFQSCSALTDVTIPESVTVIGSRAFLSCSTLASVTLPGKLETIGSEAFGSCYALKGIEIPETVTTIGDYAFGSASSFTEFVFPESVTSIGKGVFHNCGNLVSVTLPKSLTVIPDELFRNCSSLPAAELPAGIKSIGSYAFYGCTSLKNIDIPELVTSIGYYAFASCTSLTNVVIPDMVTTIGSNAFSDCTALQNVTIPESVTEIGNYAFYGCKKLAKIESLGSVTTLNYCTFDGCTSLVSVNVNEGVTAVYSSVFSGCTALKEIKLPSTLKTISSTSFYNSGLKTITIPYGVESIGMQAFAACDSLVSVRIPDTVTSIEKYAFAGTNVVIGCAAGSYAHQYAMDNGIPFDTSIEGEYDSTLTVVSGSKCRGFRLNIQSDDSLVDLTRIIDKDNVNIFGLDPFKTYTAKLLSDNGSVFSTVEGIVFTDGKAKISFNDVKDVVTVTATVFDEFGTNVTDDCTIRWYSSKGEYVKTGSSLGKAAEGDVFRYTVEFNSTLYANMYKLPAQQEVTVSADAPNHVCTLESYVSRKMTGKVKAPDGSAVSFASVTLVQKASEKITKTLTAETNENGEFEIYCKDIPSVLTVTKKGFSTYEKELASVSEEAVEVTIEEFVTTAVELSVKEKAVDSEWADALSLNDITITAYNNTKRKEIASAYMAGNQLMIPVSEAENGDDITVKAGKEGFISDDADVTLGSGSKAELSLEQLGELVIVQSAAPETENMAIVFGANGKYVDTISLHKKKGVFSGLTAGRYSVVMMSKDRRCYAPADLTAFDKLGLKNNTDYIMKSVKIENSKRTTLSDITIPKTDLFKLAYFAPEKNVLTTNKDKVALGEYLVLILNYEYKPGAVTNPVVSFALPEGFEVKPNCMTVNGNTVDFKKDGNNVFTSLKEKSGTIRLALFACGTCDASVSASVSFTANNVEQTEALGCVNCGVKDLDFYVPERTNQTSINTTGNTFPNSTVALYDNGTLAAKTTSNKAGTFSTSFELKDAYSRSDHDIYAVVTTQDGTELKSAVRTIEYAVDSTVADKLTMYFCDAHKNTSMDVMLNGQENKDLVYTFTIYDTRFTYELHIAGDPTKVQKATVLTKTQNDEYIRIPLTYDEETGTFTGYYDYTTETRPAAVSVELLTEANFKIDRKAVESSLEDLNAAFDELEKLINDLVRINEEEKSYWENFTVTEDDVRTSLLECGLTDDMLEDIDLLSIANQIQESVPEEFKQFKNEFYLQNATLVNEQKTLIGQLDSYSYPIKKVDIPDSVNAEYLIERGYSPVEQYDGEPSIFIDYSDNTEYDFVDLEKGIAVKFNESNDSSFEGKTPASSGRATLQSSGDCGCGSLDDGSNPSEPNEVLGGLADGLENITNIGDPLADKTYEILKGLMQEYEWEQNKLSNEISSLESRIPKLYTNPLRQTEPNIQWLYDDAVAQLSIKKNRYNFIVREKVKLGEKMQKVLGSRVALKSLSLAFLAKDIYDQKGYYDAEERIANLQKIMNTCQCINYDDREALTTLLNAAFINNTIGSCAHAVNTFLGVVAKGWGIVAQLGGEYGGSIATGVHDFGDGNLILEPIEYSKQQYNEFMEAAENIIKSKCKCHQPDDPNDPKKRNNIPLKSGVDPSGFVCEAVGSNRLENVTATLYYSDNAAGDNAVLWDAAEYDQMNPLLTDELGHYEWYVPDGWWQVRFEKEGYETTASEWVPVLPIQTEVNVSMKSLYAPIVSRIAAYSDCADITFSQYMELSTVNTDNVKISVNGEEITGEIVPLNTEKSFADDSVEYASKFRFVPDTALSGTVSFEIDNVKSYNGLVIDAAFTGTADVTDRIETLDVPEKIEADKGEPTEVEINILPAKADVNISVTPGSERLLSVDKNSVKTDENGTAKVTVTGRLAADTMLYVSVDDTELSAQIPVRINALPAADEHDHSMTDTDMATPDEPTDSDTSGSDTDSHMHSDTDNSSDSNVNSDSETASDTEKDTDASDTDSTVETGDTPSSDTDTDANSDSDDETDSDIASDSDTDTDNGGENNDKTGNLGDVDGDGEITANDALLALRASVGVAELTPGQFARADVDADGSITANDALEILRYSVGFNSDRINKPLAA